MRIADNRLHFDSKHYLDLTDDVRGSLQRGLEPLPNGVGQGTFYTGSAEWTLYQNGDAQVSGWLDEIDFWLRASEVERLRVGLGLGLGVKADQGKPNPCDHFRDYIVVTKAKQAAAALGQDDWLGLLRRIAPPHATLGIFDAMDYGAKKYGRDGWRTVPGGLERYKAAALRHYLHEIYYPADTNGLDSESGLHHMSHAAASIAIVLELSQ